MQIDFDSGSSRHNDVAGVPQLVLPDLWRIPLPLPFELKWVNVYVLHHGNEWVLIDCGLGTRSCIVALYEGLSALGIGPHDLTALVLTHAHPDHIGSVADLAAAMPDGSHIYMLAEDIADMYALWGDHPPEDYLPRRKFFHSSGIDDATITTLLTGTMQLAHLVHLPPRAALTALVDGQVIQLAGREWRIIWTSGHARGQICLVSDRLLISADHILPTISPNISLHPFSHPDPIQDYFNSLDRIAALELTSPQVMPGHGMPFTQLTERINDLRSGHVRRSQRIAQVVQQQSKPMTALAVAQSIFQPRHLNEANLGLAIGETLAHLQHLYLADQITLTTTDDIWYYRPKKSE